MVSELPSYNVVEVVRRSWGKPVQVTTTAWQSSQFEYIEPDVDFRKLFKVKLEDRIMIRDEYRVAYDYFDANMNFNPKTGRSTCHILAGHSGIGKCNDNTSNHYNDKL